MKEATKDVSFWPIFAAVAQSNTIVNQADSALTFLH